MKTKEILLTEAEAREIYSHATHTLRRKIEAAFTGIGAIHKEPDKIPKQPCWYRNFFITIDCLMNDGTVKRGRDFDIGTPDKLMFSISGNEKEVRQLNGQKKILFLRVSKLYYIYTQEQISVQFSQIDLEQKLRSLPSYLGKVNAHLFKWMEGKRPAEESIIGINDEKFRFIPMIMEPRAVITSCLALDYDMFIELYDEVNLERPVHVIR